MFVAAAIPRIAIERVVVTTLRDNIFYPTLTGGWRIWAGGWQ